MKLKMEFEFERDEVRSKLHYDLVASSIGGSQWNTGTNKRRLKESGFTEDDLAVIKKIYKKCSKWYLETGVPEIVKIPSDEYNVWQRLIFYLHKYFTIRGGLI